LDNNLDFVINQLRQIIDGGAAVFYRKTQKIAAPVFRWLMIPLYHLSVFIRLPWAEAYYVAGNTLKEKYFNAIASDEAYDHSPSIIKIVDRAVRYLNNSIRLKSIRLKYYSCLYGLLYSLGRYQEARTMMHQYTLLQRQDAKRHQLDKLGLEFIPRAFAYGAIGVVYNIDSYIKANRLGMRPARKPVLLVSPNIPLNNPCYIDYWKKHVTIIRSQDSLGDLAALEEKLTIPLNDVLSFHDRTLDIYVADGTVYEKWAKKKLPPLLELKEDHATRGRACLRSLGIPEKSWFVCLHVREPGWRDNRSEREDFRNCDINTYYPAISAIVDSGGWVIRMGDPLSMTPLPKMDGVIDYAHSAEKSDWMDVFLCAACRFCIGTSSGVYTIASAFGTPVLMTNGLPYVNLYALTDRDMFIPRLCRSRSKNQLLKFEELFSPPVSMASSQYEYARLGLDIIENTDEEICSAVTEMLAVSGAGVESSENDIALQTRFKSITADCGLLHGNNQVGVNARIGNRFLIEYSSLL